MNLFIISFTQISRFYSNTKYNLPHIDIKIGHRETVSNQLLHLCRPAVSCKLLNIVIKLCILICKTVLFTIYTMVLQVTVGNKQKIKNNKPGHMQFLYSTFRIL